MANKKSGYTGDDCEDAEGIPPPPDVPNNVKNKNWLEPGPENNVAVCPKIRQEVTCGFGPEQKDTYPNQVRSIIFYVS